MAPHEFAQALHSAAIALENDGELYRRYIRETSRQAQRSLLWRALKVLDPPLRDRLAKHDGVTAVEQLRRYLVDVWDVTTDNEAPCYCIYSEQPTLKFWLDEVNQPPKRKLPATILRAQQATLDRLAKASAESNALYDRLAEDLNSLIQEEPTMSKIIDITTKTFVNGIDVTTMTNAQVFDLIAEQENAIKKLEGIEAKPKLLVQEIEERKAGIAALVAHLDAKAE